MKERTGESTERDGRRSEQENTSFESLSFRTGSWEFGKAKEPDDLQVYHPTTLHAFSAAARLEQERGITVLTEKERGNPEQISYHDLYQRSRHIAAGLESRGICSDDCVLIVLPTSIDFVATFHAVQLLGAIPVPAYPPSGLRIEAGLRQLAHIANQCGAKVCVTWELVMPVVGDLGLRSSSLKDIVTVKDLTTSRSVDVQLTAKPRQLAFLQYTSGSTGNPKGVALQHDNLVSNIHTIGQAVEIRRSDVLVSWCPLYHDMGLIGALLFAIYWRLPLVLLSPMAFLSRPHRWLKAIDHYRGTLSPAPNFGYALAVKRVSEEQKKGLDLSSWRLALNGAEPVLLSTVQEFCSTYEPYGFRPESMLPVYGLAEASLAAAFPEVNRTTLFDRVDRDALARGVAKSSSDHSAIATVSVGKAVPGQRIRIVDDNGNQLPERMVGNIVAAGRSIMKGYYKNEEATSKVLRKGWLWTGDLGYVHDGELYVTGRAKDLIIVRGRNYYAEDMERVAETVAGIRTGCAVAFGMHDEVEERERIVLVAETRESDEGIKAELRAQIGEAVQNGIGVTLDDVVLLKPGSLPKTSSGKRQRALSKNLYISKRLVPKKQTRLVVGKTMVRSTLGHLLMQARRLISRSTST